MHDIRLYSKFIFLLIWMFQIFNKQKNSIEFMIKIVKNIGFLNTSKMIFFRGKDDFYYRVKLKHLQIWLIFSSILTKTSKKQIVQT